MDTASEERQDLVPDDDLSLRDAASLYDVTVRTLRQRLRAGALAGHKTRGAAGREWRVTPQGLEDAGYRRRRPLTDADMGSDVLVRLRQDLAVARRAAAAERQRADDLDRRLGHAMLEAGRLRAALAAAAGEPQRTEEALEPDAARGLIAAVRGGSPTRRRAESFVDHLPKQLPG